MLVGSTTTTVDSKARLVIPAKLRANLPQGDLIACLEPDGCLALYGLDQWRERVKRIESAGKDVVETRMLKRFVFARSEPVERDAQGRVSLPRHFLDTIGVEREVVVVGIGDRIEVWEPSKWETTMQRCSAIIEHNPGLIVTP